jgi:hypothetical protein
VDAPNSLPSVAVTVAPVTTGAGGMTRMPAWVPVTRAAGSVAVIDCVPTVFRVAVKVWTPLSAAVKA